MYDLLLELICLLIVLVAFCVYGTIAGGIYVACSYFWRRARGNPSLQEPPDGCFDYFRDPTRKPQPLMWIPYIAIVSTVFIAMYYWFTV